MPDGTCSVVGCEHAVRKRSWCVTHYERWRIHGDPEYPVRTYKTVPVQCSVAECDRPARARGWCHQHWARWKRVGSVQAEKPFRSRAADTVPGTTCSVDNCDAPYFARTWCKQHYNRWQRTGDVHADIPIVAVAVINQGKCAVSDCVKDAFHCGLCAMHYCRLKRHGHLAHPVTDEVRQSRRERRRQYDRAWKAAERDRDRQAVNDRHRAWVEANKDRSREHDARKRAVRARAPKVPFSRDDLAGKLAYWGRRCWLCGGPYEAIDHIKPLARGGWHLLANLRPICKSCNSSKGATWPFTVKPWGWQKAA